MNIKALILKHGNKMFKVDEENDLGAFMYLGEYKIHVRKDDVNLVEGNTLNAFFPLIDSIKKI